MKRIRRMVRRRSDAAKHAFRPVAEAAPSAAASPDIEDIEPVALGDQHGIPCEVIDLATGPFYAAFPAIAARLHGTKT